MKEALWLDGGELFVIDQTKLPHLCESKKLASSKECALAIADMTVRGAGVIGNVGAFGAAFAIAEHAGDVTVAKEALTSVREARPTAVNLAWAVDRVTSAAQSSDEPSRAAFDEAVLIIDEEITRSQMIAKHGYELFREILQKKGGGRLNILTHCNAGWLAILGKGSALAPIYEAYENGMDIHVWVDETRPRNQGATLTAWELSRRGVPHTLIADNTGGLLMQRGMVDACIVGADRVTRGGDVANKIGTYLKALAATEHNIPFYAALPSSTFDMSIVDGVRDIEIETRSEDEVRFVWGVEDGAARQVLICPQETRALNYGFDVTPAKFITALITEKGVCEASEQAIMRMFGDKL